jgi:penicillin V acylase-like amidase (Ntn superfamily)
MRTTSTFGSAVLALAAVAASCTTIAVETADGGGVYLVGVAGGG